MVVGHGFGPWKAKLADLQSAPVDRLGNPPGIFPTGKEALESPFSVSPHKITKPPNFSSHTEKFGGREEGEERRGRG